MTGTVAERARLPLEMAILFSRKGKARRYLCAMSSTEYRGPDARGSRATVPNSVYDCISTTSNSYGSVFMTTLRGSGVIAKADLPSGSRRARSLFRCFPAHGQLPFLPCSVDGARERPPAGPPTVRRNYPLVRNSHQFN